MQNDTQHTAPGLSDGLLLGAFARTGDPAAFERIVRAYSGLVMRVCRCVTGNQADAEDAAQAAFLALALRASQVQAYQSLPAWLCHVARKAALKVVRARTSRARVEAKGAAFSSAALTSSGVPMDPTERERRVFEAIDALPESYRVAVTMHYVQGMSLEGMAKALGCKPSAVGMRLQRARRKLRAALERRNAGLSSEILTAALGGLAVSAASAGVTESFVATTARAAAAAATEGLSAARCLVSEQVISLTLQLGNALRLAKVKTAASIAAGVFLLIGVAMLGLYTPATPGAAGPAARPAPDGGSLAADKPAEAGTIPANGVLVEAEGFDDHGGWALDSQFTHEMGSPYLLAHGLGKPVANAKTKVPFPKTGPYRLWVRTKDWVPSHHPGRFKVILCGVDAPAEFGTTGDGWIWQDGGTVEIKDKIANLELKDLTGFDGRCDALFFSADPGATPPAQADDAMAAWRRQRLGLPEEPPDAGRFDAVVVGGGIAGCAAALTAGRLGLDVALVQDRPVLGGNASPEVRIGPRGVNRSVVSEVAGPQREQVLAAQKNVRLFLGWRAFRARTQGARIHSVDAKDIRTGRELRFAAPVFIDCTGAGWVGAWAGAAYRMGREAASEFNESLAPKQADAMHHGNTVRFSTRMAPGPAAFPEVPWATAVSKDYANLGGLAHMWEYGQWLDATRNAEQIRDHLFRAVYGTFATVKGKDPQKNANLELAWVGHIAATGSSRRLIGDYILTENDIRQQKEFEDAVAVNDDHICLHYPGTQYDFRNGDWKFIAVKPYSIPFRCLYSKNVDNLMMAGKHISASHVASASVKMMLHGGQHGVAVGAAAYLCKKHNAAPREVGAKHLRELQEIVNERGAYASALRPPPGTGR
jgi:RNA polymerase sigma factor (sigma-70 family)